MSKVKSAHQKEAFKAFLLSENPSIASQQIDAIIALKTCTTFGHLSPEGQASKFNSLPKPYRENCKLIMLALRGSRYYRGEMDITQNLSDVIARLNRLHSLDNVQIFPKENTPSLSLLSWLGRNTQTAGLTFGYSMESFVEFLKSYGDKVFTLAYKNSEGGEKVSSELLSMSNTDAELFNKITFNLYNDAISALRMFGYIRELRVNKSREANVERLSLRERQRQLFVRIESSNALNWYRNLTPTELAYANKLRPVGKCVGIELEFLCYSGSDLENLDSEDYPDAPFSRFKTDGSVNAIDSCHSKPALQELNCFINAESDKDWENVEKILNELNSLGGTTNRTCGNHIHLDMRHRTNASALRTASKMRKMFKDWAHRCVPHSRAFNTYCGAFRNHDGQKYTAVNVLPLRTLGTIEVRIGTGTLNFSKLKLWTQFLQYCASERSDISTFDDFMQSDCDPAVKHFIFSRILKFHKSYVNENVPTPEQLCNVDKYRIAFNAINSNLE